MNCRRYLTHTAFFVSAVSLLAVGCTRESQNGDTRIFRFALWVPLSVLFGGILAFVLGFLLLKASKKWGLSFVFLGPLAVLVIAPGLFQDKVTVNKTHFTLRTGFWFAANTHDIPFSDLSRIEMASEEHMSRRGTQTNYFLVCVRKDGSTAKVPLGDLMKRGAADAIIQTATDLRIPVIDKTNDAGSY